MGVAEVHRASGGPGELGVPGHFRALVPGDRPEPVGRQVVDHPCQLVHRGGRGPVAREFSQQCVATGPVDQRDHCGVVRTDDQHELDQR